MFVPGLMFELTIIIEGILYNMQYYLEYYHI